MNVRASGAALLGALLLQGCGANVATTAVSPDDLRDGRTREGVVFYPPALIKLTHAFTARVDQEGNVVGTSEEGTCRQVVQKEEVTVQPDLGRPFLIRNASGAFSAAKFGVGLKDGMLLSVNVEPTQLPSELLASAATVLTGLPGVLGIGPAGVRAACNAGPRLVRFERVTVE